MNIRLLVIGTRYQVQVLKKLFLFFQFPLVNQQVQGAIILRNIRNILEFFAYRSIMHTHIDIPYRYRYIIINCQYSKNVCFDSYLIVITVGYSASINYDRCRILYNSIVYHKFVLEWNAFLIIEQQGNVCKWVFRKLLLF